MINLLKLFFLIHPSDLCRKCGSYSVDSVLNEDLLPFCRSLSNTNQKLPNGRWLGVTLIFKLLSELGACTSECKRIFSSSFLLSLSSFFFRIPWHFFVKFDNTYFSLCVSEIKLFSLELEVLLFQMKSPSLTCEVVND